MLNIRIPFYGFYNSPYEDAIESEIDQMFDIDQQGLIEAPEAFHMIAEYEAIHTELAKDYVQWFANEYDIKGLKFEALESPKYYNYETDQIYATIPPETVQDIFDKTDKAILQEVIAKRHTSRSGFMAFSKNWDSPPLEWDCTQLHTLLIAYIITSSSDKYFAEQYEPDPWEFLEYYTSNGQLNCNICDNLPKECMDMINKAYEHGTIELENGNTIVYEIIPHNGMYNVQLWDSDMNTLDKVTTDCLSDTIYEYIHFKEGV